MDFHFTDEQEEVASLARRIFSDRVTPDLLREVEAGQDRFDPGLWTRLGQSGLIGVALPEEYGGGGGGLVEQCILLEEAGRVLAPLPLLASTVGASIVARWGDEAQKQRWLPGAASGENILAVALAEPVSRSTGGGETVAEAVAGGWRLNGAKTGVSAATIAGAILVSAATGEGPAMFLVEPSQPGVQITRQRTSNRDAVGCVQLDDCLVDEASVIGPPGDRARVGRWAFERFSVALCALQVGILEEAVAATAAYTKERIAFERPIATFQAVGHRCADSYIDVEAARLTLWQAAWRLSEELPATTEVEVAKFWAAEAGHRVAHAAVHLHGGMGVAVEYPLHRYFLWAKQLEFMLGGATQQLVKIGKTLAGTAA